jgi:hypothetical protein
MHSFKDQIAKLPKKVSKLPEVVKPEIEAYSLSSKSRIVPVQPSTHFTGIQKGTKQEWNRCATNGLMNLCLDTSWQRMQSHSMVSGEGDLQAKPYLVLSTAPK